MPRWYFHKVVDKIEKNKWEIITVDQIKEILKNILKENYKDQKTYKVIHRLKNRWYLHSIKKELFFVKQPDQEIFIEEIVDRFYRSLLYEHCYKYAKSKRYISWLKALELNMSDHTPPEQIDIVNPIKNSQEIVIQDKKVIFRKRKSKNQDLYKKQRKHTKKLQIQSKNFKTANLELSILESLYNPDPLTKGYTNQLIKKITRRKKNQLNFENIKDILLLGKHHSSTNRFYKILKTIDTQKAKELNNIIKKYWFKL